MPLRVYLLGVGIALVALALTLANGALGLQPGVTEANARRIRAGMTLREVEAILGRQADMTIPGMHPETLARFWRHDESGMVIVGFGPNRRVIRGGFYYSATPPRSPLDRLRAWLGW